MFHVKTSLGKMGEAKFRNSSNILSLDKILMLRMYLKEAIRSLVSQICLFKQLHFEQRICFCLLKLVFSGIQLGNVLVLIVAAH